MIFMCKRNKNKHLLFIFIHINKYGSIQKLENTDKEISLNLTKIKFLLSI